MVGRRLNFIAYLLLNPKRLIWDAITKVGIGLIYLVFTTHGARILSPGVMAIKLHGRFGISFLSRFRGPDQWDVADLFTVMLFLVTTVALTKTMEAFLYREDLHSFDPRTDVAFMKYFFRVGTIILLTLDTILCFLGFMQHGMFGDASAFAALVFAGTYTTLLVMSAAISAYLKHN